MIHFFYYPLPTFPAPASVFGSPVYSCIPTKSASTAVCSARMSFTCSTRMTATAARTVSSEPEGPPRSIPGGKSRSAERFHDAFFAADVVPFSARSTASQKGATKRSTARAHARVSASTPPPRSPPPSRITASASTSSARASSTSFDRSAGSDRFAICGRAAPSREAAATGATRWRFASGGPEVAAPSFRVFTTAPSASASSR
mmetsp:Transcript_10183/g.43295  ORF Transcript_10183/g.43295 Transcript_10183/m.43295 type:complete len:203 (-) Transcript_10183:286-894(-)